MRNTLEPQEQAGGARRLRAVCRVDRGARYGPAAGARAGLRPEASDGAGRSVYWLHVLLPLVAGWLYWLHRLAGPRIKWRVGLAYVGGRRRGRAGDGRAALAGSAQVERRRAARRGSSTSSRRWPARPRGNFIPAKTLMMDDYCQKCHADVHAGWSHSVHRFSSFNNPPIWPASGKRARYRSSATATCKASRWCAGCHDPVPFFSGAFDDPKFDLRQASDGPGRHHLHRLPRDHARQQHRGQRRLHDRRAGALSVRQQRQRRSCSGSTISSSRPSRRSTRRRS